MVPNREVSIGEQHKPYGRLLAGLYDTSVKCIHLFTGGETRWRELLMDLISPKPGETILDLCCGTGTMTLMLADRMGGAEGITAGDISPGMIEVARRKAEKGGYDLEFHVIDARSTGLTASYFDKVMVCGALHEMSKPVRAEVLRETQRVLKPGGRLYVLEGQKPDNPWGKFIFYQLMSWINPFRDYCMELTGERLEEELIAAGYRLERSASTNQGLLQIHELSWSV